MPTLAGFIAWVRTAMGITTSVLPDDAIAFTWAYNVAVEIVDPNYACVSSLIYMLMVYNLAGSNLINFATDTPPSTYFADLRSTLGVTTLTLGIAQSASDEGTSASILIPDVLRTLSLADLQYLKDPYGRVYLEYASRMGTVWGVS